MQRFFSLTLAVLLIFNAATISYSQISCTLDKNPAKSCCVSVNKDTCCSDNSSLAKNSCCTVEASKGVEGLIFPNFQFLFALINVHKVQIVGFESLKAAPKVLFAYFKPPPSTSRIFVLNSSFLI